jgi:xanthine dehydrogenase large subunit
MNNLPHDSAKLHVTGEAVYVNDMPANRCLLIGKVVYSKYPHARILSVDISKVAEVRKVHAVITYKDIPGKNNMGPVVHDEPCLAENEVNFIGQAIVLIAAETEDACLEAEKAIIVEYEPLEAILDIETAIEKNNLIAPPRKIERGRPDEKLSSCEFKIKDTLRIGGQEHWYLETQSCLCVPGESGEMLVYSSTQNPSETQLLIAEVLGFGYKEVTIETRRIGGGFGGKETQGNHVACWAALLANKTKRPVKIHLSRDDDQKITGKRHRFIINYEVGFNKDGIIEAVIFEQNADAGAATDLSMAILERAMLHAENCYYIPDIRIIAKAWKTNLPSNTAFRGFGGPQGMAAIESIIDRIARFLKKDPAEVRAINFYGINENNVTPYEQLIENNHLAVIYDKLIESSAYWSRRKDINEFNCKNEILKKGLALTPVKFGISFTTSFLNQAGALVLLYKDGTVLVNHGGTEMGQGLYTKIIQIAAAEFGLDAGEIKVAPTNTSKVPNTSPTAASSGSDLNGMAVKNAIDILKSRITEVVVEDFNKELAYDFSKVEHIVFQNNDIIDSKHLDRMLSFKEAVSKAYFRQLSLSANGFYKTPDINFDREKGCGKPFHYFSYGMAVSEVMIDTLTGNHKILRTDILQDCGNSINSEIDKGQITGGFIQGVGWCTTEELRYDDKGNLLTHSPDTYKIPTIQDIPEDFRVELLDGFPNFNTIRKSKAIGEPPFMLSFSVWLAIKDAISAIGHHRFEPEFSLPATNEVILLSIEKLRNKIGKEGVS